MFEAGQIKACVGLTFPDRIHSFHIKHTQPQRGSVGAGGNLADGAVSPGDPQELATWKVTKRRSPMSLRQSRVCACRMKRCKAKTQVHAWFGTVRARLPAAGSAAEAGEQRCARVSNPRTLESAAAAPRP